MAILAVFGGLVLIVGSLLLSSILNGYVLSVLWGWFMVPIFHLPNLSVVPAIGISLVIGFLTHQTQPDCVEKERSSGQKIAVLLGRTFAIPLFSWFFGWVVHLFM